jgi:hypothetical protein
MQVQASLFDTPAPTEAPKTLGVLTIEWNSLCYQARCCLGDMAGLAKQHADEIEEFIKYMLQDNVERRSKNKVTLGFTPQKLCNNSK